MRPAGGDLMDQVSGIGYRVSGVGYQQEGEDDLGSLTSKAKAAARLLTSFRVAGFEVAGCMQQVRVAFVYRSTAAEAGAGERQI
jgi:hypothetical protein